jgi:RNA polymerase sigma-70 factor (ECF subfamily)
MDLIAAARKGREEALLRLFDEHHGALFRFAWRMTGSAADAEDIVQECFLSLARPGSSYDAGRGGVRSYLFGAVRNQALKRMRRQEEALPEGAVEPDGRSPESAAMRGEVGEAVARAIAGLPDGQREVLLLAHYEQLPLAEIAAALEIEVAAVKSRLQRARAALKESLAAFAPGVERRQ